jgi:hypothetical protein
MKIFHSWHCYAARDSCQSCLEVITQWVRNPLQSFVTIVNQNFNFRPILALFSVIKPCILLNHVNSSAFCFFLRSIAKQNVHLHNWKFPQSFIVALRSSVPLIHYCDCLISRGREAAVVSLSPKNHLSVHLRYLSLQFFLPELLIRSNEFQTVQNMSKCKSKTYHRAIKANLRIC